MAPFAVFGSRAHAAVRATRARTLGTRALAVGAVTLVVLGAGYGLQPNGPADLALAATGTTESSPRHSAMAVVDRLAETNDAVPHVTGSSLDRARAALGGADLTVQPVALVPDDDTVTAQWPEPGEAEPDDGVVLVWVGAPPAPPLPPAPAGANEPIDESTATPTPTPTESPQDSPTEEPSPQATATPDEEQPLERTSPRRIPASEAGHRVSGPASWYGAAFAGRRTACGDTFDPGALTLATRELRCGTQVRITGPAGSVEATVTDWGPAEWTQRRFDLAEATFAAIAPLGAGVVDVEVEVIGP